jgi:hypothetical protein
MTSRCNPAGRLSRLAVTSGAALALFAALPASSAYADASGTFYYSSSVGDFSITDPALHTCEPLHGGATSASNQTNADANIYYDSGCQNPWGKLLSGNHTTFFGDLPRSVSFGA